MKKLTIRRIVKARAATALLAATSFPALASSTWVSDMLLFEASLAPVLALGLSALLYLRSGMDA